MLNQTQNVLNRLVAADREHQKESGARLLLGNVRQVCLFILAAFILDVVFHLGAGWRLGLLLALIAGVIALFIVGWHRAFVRRNRLEHIARFLETRDPALGSRLINLLQLRGQMDDASLTPLTRELARQAVENYAGELGGLPLENLARTGEWHRQFKRAACALLGFAAVLAAFFRISPVEFARFTDPFGDHPPYSFTQLAIVSPGPAGTNVLYGKGLVVRVKASGHQPKEVFLTSQPPGHPERAITLPMFDKGAIGYDQLLDNVRTNLVVFAHTKDGVSVSKQVPIGVILTPQLEHSFVQVTPPPYTGLKAAEKPYAFNGVQALSGSEVRFRVQSNRPLREGRIEIASGEQPPASVKMKKTAANEVSGAFVAAESGRLHFTVVDVDGLPSQGDCQGALTVTYDLPPEVRITEPDHDAFVAMDFKLQAHIAASDDYGLQAVRLHRGLNGVYSVPKVVTYDTVVRDSDQSVDFDFAGLGIEPGDIISLFAEAVDTAPQPHLTRSQTIRLQVISVEEYNNFLREQTDIEDAAAKYAGLNDDLQQLIEEQKKLGDAAQKLAGLLAKAGPQQREALVQELDGLLAGQNELDQKLNHQAERMENFVREHPLYDVEQDLQGRLRQQAENIRQSTRTNAAAARVIAQRSAPPGGGRSLSPDLLENFKQESDAQVSRLGGVHDESEQQIVQALDNLAPMQELVKDFNQFESLYRTQQELAAQTQAYNRPGQLSREDQLALADLAATEKQVADLLQLLGGKLRDDAADAKKLFPKAAQSGLALADKMEELRLHPLAEQATGQMLAGNGDQSFNLADRLRSEMEKLFGECQGGNCPSPGELDAYLRLQRMHPGNSFAQMSRSRKFGSASGKGPAQGQGQGGGVTGTSGYAVMDGQRMSVMGNESSASRSGAAARQSSRFGKGAGGLAGGAGRTDVDKSDVMKGLNPVNRQSGAVPSGSTIEEYNDVVENYFKAITTKTPPPSK
jgi:hypothetical protein